MVRMTLRGSLEYAITTEAIRRAGQIAAERSLKELLVDLREADYEGYYVDAIRHAKEGRSLGIDAAFRIGMVGARDNDAMLRFFEDVCVNRGYQAKTFTDERQAKAWISGTSSSGVEGALRQ